jgi:hypothetical protein
VLNHQIFLINHHQFNHQSKNETVMKQLAITALFCLTGMWAQAQTTETRSMAVTAAKLDVKNGIEVIIIQSDTLALRVETSDAQVLKQVITKYSGSTLKVYLNKPYSHTTAGTVKVYLSQKSLPAIKGEGGAAVKALGKWQLSEAKITLATGAHFTGELDLTGTCTVNAASGSGFRGLIKAATFKATATGGAFIKVMGSAGLADVSCNSGSVQAGKFNCGRALVVAQNASSVCIHATDSIKADTDASSSITYYGEPGKTETGDTTYTIKRETNKLSLN